MTSIRDIALSQPDLSPTPVYVPEWGTTVYVKPLDGFELARFYFEGGGDAAVQDFPRLVVATAMDAAGRPVFKAEDLPALRRKPQQAIVRLADEAIRLNRLGVEEAKKDSGATPDSSAS